MAAHEGKSVPLCQREAAAADFPLDAAAVDDQRVRADRGCVFLQPGGAAVRIDGQQDQVALADVILRQRRVNRTGKLGERKHGFISYAGVHGVSGDGIGSGEASANQAKS